MSGMCIYRGSVETHLDRRNTTGCAVDDVIGVKVRLKSKDLSRTLHNFTKSILEAFVTRV